MSLISIRSTIAAGLILMAASASTSLGDGSRTTALARYGIAGHIQPVGVHHGFHIERVVPESPAAEDHLLPHDVIVKVDEDVIRNLDHLRAVLAEAYVDNGEVTLHALRGSSLVQHVVKCHLKAAIKPVVSKAHKRDAEEDEAPR